MGAAFNDEPNYFLRGVVFVVVGIGVFFGLTWLQTAGIEAVDSSEVMQILYRARVPYFAGALFVMLGFVSWIRGLMSLAAHLNSCFITMSLGFLVLLTITGIYLFIEYRPDLAAERVAERNAPENEIVEPEEKSELRTFTSADGRKMKATFLSFDGKKVEIRREDGEVFTNGIELYSEADSDYIRNQLSKLK